MHLYILKFYTLNLWQYEYARCDVEKDDRKKAHVNAIFGNVDGVDCGDQKVYVCAVTFYNMIVRRPKFFLFFFVDIFFLCLFFF